MFINYSGFAESTIKIYQNSYNINKSIFILFVAEILVFETSFISEVTQC